MLGSRLVACMPSQSHSRAGSGAHKSIREKSANSVGVAQGEDVDDLLRGAVAGDAPDVRGDHVDKAVRDRNEPAYQNGFIKLFQIDRKP